MHELVEMEVRELLTQYEYDGDAATFVKGSALCALQGNEPELGVNALESLVQAMDSEFTLPERDNEKSFLLSVDTAMNISGRGCVVTGTVEQGSCKVGDDMQLIGVRRRPTPTQVTGIETFRQQLDSAECGDNVGVLLKGVNKEEVKRGMCVIQPGTLDVRRNFDAQIYVLKEDEGGRKKPFQNGYRPQCFLRTADVAVDVTLPDNMTLAMPGDNFACSLKLSYPLPVQEGLKFALREGGKTVAAGVVTKLKEDTEADFKEEEERVAKTRSKTLK